MPRRSTAAACLFALSLPLSVGAQGTPETRLTRPDAQWEEPLSSIRGLRQLTDGRVLLSDGIDNVLLRLDLARQQADTIGRTGAGPGEYKSPDQVFGMPGGGTLLLDLGNGRLTDYLADGKVKESLSVARGEPGQGLMLVVPPLAVDGQGRIYFQVRGGGPGGAPPDSAPVIRWDRARDTFDTLAKVKLPSVRVSTSGSANNRNVQMRPRPLTTEDGWAVAPDGRLGIVRAADYHVEWLALDGRVIRGPAIPYSPVKVTMADKKEWISQTGDGVSVSVSNNNGEIRTSFARGRGGRTPPSPDDFEWPEVKPPFAAGSVVAAPDGNLWVRRYTAAGQPAAYDVFGSDGRLARRVILPAGRRLEGFGTGTVYLSRADESDLRYLERYKYP